MSKQKKQVRTNELAKLWTTRTMSSSVKWHYLIMYTFYFWVTVYKTGALMTANPYPLRIQFPRLLAYKRWQHCTLVHISFPHIQIKSDINHDSLPSFVMYTLLLNNRPHNSKVCNFMHLHALSCVPAYTTLRHVSGISSPSSGHLLSFYIHVTGGK